MDITSCGPWIGSSVAPQPGRLVEVRLDDRHDRPDAAHVHMHDVPARRDRVVAQPGKPAARVAREGLDYLAIHVEEALLPIGPILARPGLDPFPVLLDLGDPLRRCPFVLARERGYEAV